MFKSRLLIQKLLCLILTFQIIFSSGVPAFAGDPSPASPPANEIPEIAPTAETAPTDPAPNPIPPNQVPPHISATIDQLEQCMNLPVCSSDALRNTTPFRTAENPCEPSPQRVEELRSYMRSLFLRSELSMGVLPGRLLVLGFSFLTGAGGALSALALFETLRHWTELPSNYQVNGVFGTLFLALFSTALLVTTRIVHFHANQNANERYEHMTAAGYPRNRVGEVLRAQRRRMLTSWVGRFTRELRAKIARRTSRPPRTPEIATLPPASGSNLQVHPNVEPGAQSTPTAQPTEQPHPSTRVRVVLDNQGNPCVEPASITAAADAAYDELAELQALEGRARGGRTQRRTAVSPTPRHDAHTQQVLLTQPQPVTATPTATPRRPRRVLHDPNPPAQPALNPAMEASQVLSDAPATPFRTGTGATESIGLPALATP